MSNNRIALNPSVILRVLALTICFLFAAHIVAMWAKHVLGYPTVYGLVPLFDLGAEQNVPTFFSACLHLFSSMLLASIAIMKKHALDRYTKQWAILAAAFLYMAFDEAAGLHELMGRPMQELLGGRATGVLFYAWVVPGIVITVLFAAWFLKFFLHLPPKTRWLVFTSAALFIGGAIGVELFEGRHVALHGPENLTYALYVLVEETLEMAGIALFIYALLRYIETTAGEVRVRVGVMPNGSSRSSTSF